MKRVRRCRSAKGRGGRVETKDCVSEMTDEFLGCAWFRFEDEVHWWHQLLEIKRDGDGGRLQPKKVGSGLEVG